MTSDMERAERRWLTQTELPERERVRASSCLAGLGRRKVEKYEPPIKVKCPKCRIYVTPGPICLNCGVARKEKK